MTETTGRSDRRVGSTGPTSPPLTTTPADRLFPGGGKLGELIRAKDWSDTPLGPIDGWPQSLKTAVSVALYAGFPMIVLWGPSLVQIYNDRYRVLMGAKHPAGLGQANRECWPEAWHINETIYPRVFAGETVSFEETLYPLAPYGVLEDHYLTLSYSPVRDERGDVGGVFVTVFDVTSEVRTRYERDQALAEAKAERARIYEGFDQAPAAIAVLEGAEHRFTVTNPRYRALIGGRDVIGLPLAEALPEVEAQGFTALLDRVRSSGEPFVANEALVRLDRRGDGVLEDIYVDFVYQPLRDATGTVFGIMAHAVETTGQVRARQAQEELQRAVERERNRLAEVVQQAPAVIAVTEGPEHVILTSNPLFRQVVGARRALDGLPVREALPDLDGLGFFELLDQVYATGEPFVGTEMLARIDRDGDGVSEDSYFNFVYHPLRDADGSVRGIMIHAVEVTEQVRARKDVELKADELVRLTHALEQSNRELDQFAYVASHDLKAPLRGIANLTEWIEEDLGERIPDSSREHMRLLKGRVHRMEALIDGILAYSRAGRVRTPPERVDTGALVREVVELLAPPPNVAIEVQPELPTVDAERVPLQQVFMNLIGNAVKYAGAVRDDVRVRVGWRSVRDAYEFTVADNGPGIAPEYHERVWGIFQTLQPRDKVEGTGIGLSVVKKIVETRGGHAWIESPAGDGAAFHFTWPKTPRVSTEPTEPIS
jgi:signal transduction histidine kinase